MKEKAARIVFLLSAAVVLAAVVIFVHVHTALSVDTEVEALVKVDVFAFGPIYDEGIIADGERGRCKRFWSERTRFPAFWPSWRPEVRRRKRMRSLACISYSRRSSSAAPRFSSFTLVGSTASPAASLSHSKETD